MRRALFTLMLLAAVAHATTIYKWVDDQGVTHFSDQPFPGAQKVHVDEAQSYTSPALAGASRSSPPPATARSSLSIARS